MKGYIGFEDGLINGKQKYIENTVIEAEAGIIFCKLPNQVFEYCDPRYGNEFAEVEALGEVHTDDGETFVAKKLKIGKKISVAELCKRSVPDFFAAFEFDKKIKKAKQSKENCSGDYGAASADNCGAANAGIYGAANAGDFGAATTGGYGAANTEDWSASNAGHCGAANAGDYSAANAGDWGAANAGDEGAANVGSSGTANAGEHGAARAGKFGAANVGNWGAANVENYGTANAGLHGVASAGDGGVANAKAGGAAIVQKNGAASVGTRGAAVAFDGWAKGAVGSVLVLIETDDNTDVKYARSLLVDGDKVKAGTYYSLKNGQVVEKWESEIKFKVGDIVSGVDKSPYSVTNAEMTKGKVLAIWPFDGDADMQIEILEHKTLPQTIGQYYEVNSNYFKKAILEESK